MFNVNLFVRSVNKKAYICVITYYLSGKNSGEKHENRKSGNKKHSVGSRDF